MFNRKNRMAALMSMAKTSTLSQEDNADAPQPATEPAQKTYTVWPAYRVSQGALRTMQWRLNDCFRQQRMPNLEFGSQAAVDLLTFLAAKADGGKMNAPGIKR